MSGLLSSSAEKRLMVFTAMSAFLTILGPFGSDAISPLWARGLYWFGLIFGGAGCSIFLTALWNRFTNVDESPIFSLPSLTLVLAISVPVTGLVVLLDLLFEGASAPITLLTLFFYVVTITLAITAAIRILEQSQSLQSALEEAEKKAEAIHREHHNDEGTLPTPTFATRLSPRLRQATILSITAEDHYLQVTTTEGREQVRCTMSEAADELAQVNGRVIHRSHWVAHDAVDHLERTGGRAFAVLTDGRKLPVSRSRLATLQAEGWLPEPRKPQAGAHPSGDLT